MVRNERERDDALEKVTLQMKWWLMGTAPGGGWVGGGGSESFLENPATLSLMCPCLIWFGLFTLELLTALVCPCAEARKALLICW